MLSTALAPEYFELTHDDDYRGGDFRLVIVSTKFVGLSGSQVSRGECARLIKIFAHAGQMPWHMPVHTYLSLFCLHNAAVRSCFKSKAIFLCSACTTQRTVVVSNSNRALNGYDSSFPC